jgi:hypothetical protein
MMVTSNRPPTDWYTLFPTPVLAESALDRLVDSACYVIFRAVAPTDRCDDPIGVSMAPGGFEEQQSDRPRHLAPNAFTHMSGSLEHLPSPLTGTGWLHHVIACGPIR